MYTDDVEGGGGADCGSGDQVGPVAVVEGVPGQRTEHGGHDAGQRQAGTEHVAAQADSHRRLHVDLHDNTHAHTQSVGGVA